MGLPKINFEQELSLTVASNELEKHVQVQHEFEMSSVSHEREESKPKYLPGRSSSITTEPTCDFSYVWPQKKVLKGRQFYSLICIVPYRTALVAVDRNKPEEPCVCWRPGCIFQYSG